MIKKGFIFLIFFTSFNFWGQEKATLTAAVDSTVIKIGERLNYILQVKARAKKLYARGGFHLTTTYFN